MYSLRTSGALSGASHPSHSVRVAPSRSRIDAHEPSVGFTVVTDRPFARIAVATSPDAFAASRRSAGTYHDSPLQRGPGELAFMLPAAFVATALKATPRPSRLYFLAIAYTSEGAMDPVYSVPPDRWATGLPFVDIDPELRQPAIASALGVALDRLVAASDRARDPGSMSTPYAEYGNEFTPEYANGHANGYGYESGVENGQSYANGHHHGAEFGPRPGYSHEHEDGYGHAAANPPTGVAWRQEARGALGAPRVATRGLEVHGLAYADESPDYQDAPQEWSDPDPDPREAYAAPDSWGGHEARHSAAHEGTSAGRARRAPVTCASCNGTGHHGGAHGAHVDSSGEDFVYDDGHGALAPAGHATSLDSEYPRGAGHPDDLPDEEHSDYGDEADWANGAAAAPVSAVAPQTSVLDRVVDAVAAKDQGTLFSVARPTSSDGLAFGVLQATQRSGELGALVDAMARQDGRAFEQIFGEEARELRDVTTAREEQARMRPVHGRPLTDETWIAKFQAAGRHPTFVDVQRRIARERVQTALLPIARDLGIATARGLAILLAVTIAKGVEPGLRWITSGVGPASSPAHRERALSALGHTDVAAFQRSEGLPPSGELDAATHARLTRNLRELGPQGPVPVLSGAQLVQALVRQAAAEPFARKLGGLVASHALDDREI